MENNTITAKELVELGYKKGTAVKAIRETKAQLVKEGYTFYNNQRLGRVPKSKVMKMLGLEL